MNGYTVLLRMVCYFAFLDFDLPSCFSSLLSLLLTSILVDMNMKIFLASTCQ